MEALETGRRQPYSPRAAQDPASASHGPFKAAPLEGSISPRVRGPPAPLKSWCPGLAGGPELSAGVQESAGPGSEPGKGPFGYVSHGGAEAQLPLLGCPPRPRDFGNALSSKMPLQRGLCLVLPCSHIYTLKFPEVRGQTVKESAPSAKLTPSPIYLTLGPFV